MLKIIPITIIIVLTFILMFSASNLTIQGARLSYLKLLVLLISQLCIFCYGLIHKQIYTMLIPGLILLGLLYTLYIKQIYIREAEIIQDLKEKDIISELTN